MAHRGVSGLFVALLLAGASGAEPPEPWTLQDARPTDSEVLVLQYEWATDLLEHLGLTDALPAEHDARDVFGLLCADQAARTVGVDRRDADAGFRVAIEPPPRRAPTDPIRVVVSVPETALYQLTVEGTGRQRWVVDQRPVGHLDLSALGVAQAPAVVALREGPHEIAGYLGPAARVDRIELVAYRVLCIAPAEGWRAERPLSYGGRARALVRAFGLEHRLDEVEEKQIRIQGESFDEVTAGGGRTNRRIGEPASNRAWAAAVQSPAEFTWRVGLSEPGVVTITARTHGPQDQIWSVDGHYRYTLRPETHSSGFTWNRVATLPLSSGQHAIRALIPRGSGVDELRVIRHRSTDEDYIDVLREIGFGSGPPDAPVPRSAALDLLSSPSFAELAAGFRLHIAGDTSDRSIVLVDEDPAPLTSRPLSPMLPAEL